MSAPPCPVCGKTQLGPASGIGFYCPDGLACVPSLLERSSSGSQDPSTEHVHDWLEWGTWHDNPYYLARRCSAYFSASCGGVELRTVWWSPADRTDRTDPDVNSNKERS